MVLEVLLFMLLVVGLCIVVYKGAVHEFQILQKEYAADMEWSEVLTEQLPIVIRNLPRSWLGGWTQAKTEHKTWLVTVEDTNGKRFKTTWNHWLATPSPAPRITNMEDICDAVRLQTTFSNWTLDGLRRWSWLPVGAPTPHVLAGGAVEPLRSLFAEYTAIVSTDGEPLELWIAHEGAIPSKAATKMIGRNPWTTTTKDVPWISEAKYVEVKLRPGNAILLPRHWYVALRSTGTERSWFWIGTFHTPISKMVSTVAAKSQN